MDGNNLDSWSIPKKKPPQDAPPMDMAIPKKKKPPSDAAPPPPPPMNMAIPKRSLSGSGPPKKRPAPVDMSVAIPRRNSGSGMDKIPRRPSFDPAETLLSINHPSKPKYHEAVPPIPRKKHLTKKQYSSDVPPERPLRGIVSEFPFIVRLSTRKVPMNQGIPRFRTSVRPEKRVRKNYKEVDEDDDGDLLTDSDDDDDESKLRKKKKTKLKKFKSESSLATTAAAPMAADGPSGVLGDEAITTSAAPVMLDTTSLDAPPPGTLHTLWYSRECFLHLFVVEKIIAWKTRNVTTLEWVHESLPEGGPPSPTPTIDSADAAKWSNMALNNPMIWTDPNKRMEVSRLVPTKCPVVATMATAAQSNEGPRFRIKELAEKEREEVYLVKWRGRSHLHASWERGSDIIKFDASNNTARHKIRRFVQSQEIAFGNEWKQVLEEERATSATIHAHGEQPTAADADSVEEEYYPPANVEIERILACDESEMDMSLFAKQRGLNIKNEQDRMAQKENGTARKWNSKEGLDDLLQERPWDPEDNVRYVVKWKGLPFAEMTWEYWRDIKRDAVDEAEDFWLRQEPPSPEQVIHLVNKPHPRISEFRKLNESPVFGISKRTRPVADMGQAKEEDEEPSNSGFRLRSYQLEGVNWLLFNWWNRRSCILADEMGLGKTIQSMCFIKSLQDLPTTEVRGPFLIVAPLSLIGQWQSEAQTWAPDLNVVLYHGSADAREFLVKQDFYYTDQFVPKSTAIKLKKQHVTKFHVLITTYEVVLKDVSVFSKIKWRALIVDEAHRLKNSRSRLFEDLGTVPRDFCLLLTGTPLANATEELWALLHFADNKAFADKDEFLEKFGQLKDADQVSELHTILKPYLLRREKEDVEKALPPKEETILEVSLTPIQKKYYKAIYERNTAFLYKGAKPSNAPSLMNVMMELRKCCNHPYLVRGAEERILADAAAQINPSLDSEGNPQPLDHGKIFGDQLVKSSGKMVLLNKLLPKLFSSGHKVLIFSQMVRVLDLLEELLKVMKYKYERLDGATSSSSRAAAVDRFCRASCQRFVMLLSTRAGGLGLNLTAADIVIIFDSDWNPQNDLQAMARAHRIGQTRAVRVYRLLTAKTYEMHMFHSASMKLGLERAVLSQQRDQGEEGESNKSKSRSEKEAQAKEIDSLLKKGAYDVFKEEDDEEAQKFMETDIDQLLESNAQTVTYGSKDTSSSGGLGSFSKASFVTDTGDGEKDVDLDDPDFWRKAAGLEAPPAEVPEEVAQMLDDGVKRSRKQVQQFDPYADIRKIEQEKEEKRLQKIKEEKEEKERLRIEKRMKKIMEKERRKKEKQELQKPLMNKLKLPVAKAKPESKFKLKKKALSLPTTKLPLKEKTLLPKEKTGMETKSIKPKKSGERKRAIRRAQYEDPEVERLKQAWDTPQRNRAVAACLRFGFNRYCKIRSEANLTSLPTQDIEIFFRAYFYQLTLQVVVTLIGTRILAPQNLEQGKIILSLREYLGDCPIAEAELDWLCECIANAMKHYVEMENKKRSLRLPMVLAEPNFVSELRKGAALRSLRRIFVMSRIARVVEDRLDEALTEIGYEQLGKRGCPTSNFDAMDVDLKARLVSTEELLLNLSGHLGNIKGKSPVAWWDRSCDIALIIGTFVHGLGNFDAMVSDESLPFSFKIKQFAESDEACADSFRKFVSAAKATSKVFHSALDAAKIKDQLQIQAAVAAAAAASSKREKDALALREGGEAADAVSVAVHETPADKLYETDGDDSHFVTLARLKKTLCVSVRAESTVASQENEAEAASKSATGDAESATGERSGRKRGNSQLPLTMPDAGVLYHRLLSALAEVERNAYFSGDAPMEVDRSNETKGIGPASDLVSLINDAHQRASRLILGEPESFETLGVGLHGNQCAAIHRSLDDGSDYFTGSANFDLSQIAYGSDSPRYLRAIGIPMNMTRFAVLSLVHADDDCVSSFMAAEKEKDLRRAGTTTEDPGASSDSQTDKIDAVTRTQSDSPVQVIKEKVRKDASNDAPEIEGIQAEPLGALKTVVEKAETQLQARNKAMIDGTREHDVNEEEPRVENTAGANGMSGTVAIGNEMEQQASSLAGGSGLTVAELTEQRTSNRNPLPEVEKEKEETLLSSNNEEKPRQVEPDSAVGTQKSESEAVNAGNTVGASSNEGKNVESIPKQTDPVAQLFPTTAPSGSLAPENRDPDKINGTNGNSEGILDVKEETTSTVPSTTPNGDSRQAKPKDADSANNIQASSVYRVPKSFEESPILRCGICLVVLYYGPPSDEEQGVKICGRFRESIERQFRDDEAFTLSDYLFSKARFLELLDQVTNKQLNHIPDFDEIKKYVSGWLLPHCLRLCLMGNGPTLENARGSKGKYETALGISLSPEPTEKQQCSLPDPCLPLKEHSTEALASAFAILRRVQLLRAAAGIASGNVPFDTLDSITRSPFMRKSMSGLPIWWCPWIHDTALLMHAVARGLFSVVRDRGSFPGSPFSRESIEAHMRSTFFTDKVAVRKVVSLSTGKDAEEWIVYHSQQFPSARVLERRLAFLCAKATDKLQGDEPRYDNVPMFDHLSWPRN